MGKNAYFVSHKKSKLKENGGPKLPLAADLVEGEIAINFGKDVETLSIKNESGTVVTFSSDNYYTEKKLGSGFTGENSARTVTDAIVNADWDETDETSGAFILNKPFGEICITDYKTYFDGEVSLSSDYRYYAGDFIPTSGVELKYGDICRVTIDNTEYEVKVVKCDPRIGNEFLALNIEDGATEFEPTDWGIVLPGENETSGYFCTTGSVESVDLKIELSPYANIGSITDGTLEEIPVEYYKSLTFPLEYEPKYGDTCIVTIDGVAEEKSIVKCILDNEYLAINVEDGAQTPLTNTWSILLREDNCYYFLYDSGDTATTTTIGVVKFGKCEIKKIDSKYLDIETCCWESTDDGGVIQKDGNNTAKNHAVAEGFNTTAGYMSHAEGNGTTASGSRSHAEGSSTTASGQSSHAEGNVTIASGNSSHAEGTYTTASGNYSHAEGQSTQAYGNNSHAEGYLSDAYGYQSHAEGQSTKASGSSSHAEGYSTTANGDASHSEGYNSIAEGDNSHAEGSGTTASGNSSHAEGYRTRAVGHASHAEGIYSGIGEPPTAYGVASHVEGIGTTASGNSSHAEGTLTKAEGGASHAEGEWTNAVGEYTHSEGRFTAAFGEESHAEGLSTKAFGEASHAEGRGTSATNPYEHASGQYNVSNSATTEFGNSGNTLFSVGNGRYDTSTATEMRHNAFDIRQNGDIYITSGGTTTSPAIKLQDYIGETVDAYTKEEIDNLVGSGFTSSSITEVIIENEEIISAALTDLDERKLDASAYTPLNEVEVNSGDTPISNSVELWVDESYSSATADVYSKTEIDSLLTLKQNVIEDSAAIGGGYGTCRTAGVTSAKTVAINDFVLVPNMHVSVLFEHAFEVSNPTLNINDTGAYPIMLYNYPIPIFKITEETILTMVFDGTNYNVVSIEREASLPGVSAVDLGLPSGVKWASMNVEAQTPEDNGFYFSWGNVIGHAKGSEPDFGTSNDTEPYVSSKGAEITGGSGTQIAVGNTYDMAHATMGYPWRLPTYADFQELCSNCTSTWVTQNGVRGRRFVSNINGEAIFFPATGYYNSTILTDEGTYGKYWSSVLASESAAHDFSFNSESVNYQNSNQRYLGFNVRAVQ